MNNDGGRATGFECLNRRQMIKAASAVLIGAPSVIAGPHPTDVRVENVAHSYQDFKYRTPYKFGGRAVDRVTLLNVECTVRTHDGKTAKGFGSMPMGNVWAFPSHVLSYDQTLAAMTALALKIDKATAAYREYGHP